MQYLRQVVLSVLLLPALVPGQIVPRVPLDVTKISYQGPLVQQKAGPPAVTLTSGRVQVVVRLSDPPLTVAVGPNAKQAGITMTAAQQQAYVAQLKQKQDSTMSQMTTLGGVDLGRLRLATNAIIVDIPAAQLTALSKIPGVVAVRPVVDSQIALSETVQYVGGTTVHNNGFTGAGVRVAMLDTGVDYTHIELGGSGLLADYAAAKAAASTTAPANLFPNSRIIGGFDFVGETWNGSTVTTLTPDPNPIDANGHGTLTADTMGGLSGMAPNTQIYSVKVCSAVASACSGIAILEGIEFALDPTNSGTLNNAVDVISMSIGEDFGQREDESSQMFSNAVQFGVVAVVSAGNSGNVPYIVGSASTTPEVISTAATQAVDAFGIPLVITAPPSIAGTYGNTATVSWAPVGAGVAGNIVYVGRGCPGDTLLANPTGLIALVDRGTCAISLKVDNVVSAGAVGVLVGLVAPGDAVTFSFGGGTNFAPTLVITQSIANTIKTALPNGTVTANINPNNAISVAGSMATFSSRGPNYSYNMIKPDMAAPGTVTGAAVGTGTGSTTESGTSFSCPLTAGAAALILSQHRGLSSQEVKALLMGNTEPNVTQNPLTMPGVLAPITWAGAGELRVDRAAASTTAVWDASAPYSVSLSFGTYRLNANARFSKKVVVRNYSSSPRTYTISNTYRDAPNTTGAVLTTPGSITVPANGASSFTATLQVTAANLPPWTLNGGSNGGNGALLQTVEFAGILTFTGGPDTVHVPWHILPHKAANVLPSPTIITLNTATAPLAVSNLTGAVNGGVDVFSLTGTGTQFPSSVLPAPGDNFAIINLRAAGVRLVCTSNPCSTPQNFGVQFAINTFGQRSHPDVPAEFDVHIDANNDGVDDFIIFNEDIGLATAGANSGQNGVFVFDVAAGTSTLVAFAVADLDSADMVYTVPLTNLSNAKTGIAVGISSPFVFSVFAFDNYFTGNLTDLIGPMTYELDSPTSFTDSISLAVTAGATANLTVFNNANTLSPSQIGLLLMYTNGLTNREADIIPVTVTPLPQ
jgi:subtilisin family serine protease